MAASENENGELDWNVDMEVQFFHAMKGHKPVGVNRYFQMACIHEKFSNSINKEISSKQIWSHLDGMYDMAALHESEIIPFPNNELEFFLPDSDYGTLKCLKYEDESTSTKDEKISKSEKSAGKSKGEGKNISETLGSKTKDGSVGKTSPGSGGTNKLSKSDGFVGSQKSGKEVHKSTEKSGKDSKFSKDFSKESGGSKNAKDNANKANKLEGGKELNVVLKSSKDKDNIGKLKVDNNTNTSKNTKDVIGKTKSLDNLKEIKNSKETINKNSKSDGSKTKGETLNRGKDGIVSDDSNPVVALKPAKLQVLIKDDIVENSPKRKRSGRPLKEDSSKPSSPATPASKRRRT